MTTHILFKKIHCQNVYCPKKGQHIFYDLFLNVSNCVNLGQNVFYEKNIFFSKCVLS